MSSKRNLCLSTETFWKINIFYIYLYKINIIWRLIKKNGVKNTEKNTLILKFEEQVI